MKFTSWFAICALLVSALALGLGTASATQFAGDQDVMEAGMDSQSNIVAAGDDDEDEWEEEEEEEEDDEWEEEEEEEEDDEWEEEEDM